MAKQMLTASEIGNYVYCHRSWWLDKVNKNQPLNLAGLKSGPLARDKQGSEVQPAIHPNRTTLELEKHDHEEQRASYLNQAEQAHEEHGRKVQHANRLNWIAMVLISAAVILTLLYSAWAILQAFS